MDSYLNKAIRTIGHSTRTPDELIAMLYSFGVSGLADIRHYPGSSRYPHFNKEALALSLPAINIRYIHFRGLGGRRKPALVEFGRVQYISITGKGDPSGKTFAEKIQALYTVAYAIKFSFKLLDKDFTVPKLEGLWWYDENKYPGLSMTDASVKVPRSEWEYRLLIRMPEYVSLQDVTQGIQTAVTKKQLELTREVKYFEMTEGKCVQMLHTGPYSTELETLEKMMAFIQSHKLGKNGLHHEIYLSDFRTTAPEKLKTILREPVR